MRGSEPRARLVLGIIVERRKANSVWLDFVWRITAVLPGEPAAVPWTVLEAKSDRTTFYAGATELVLHRSSCASYRDNLATGEPKLWVVLRPTGSEPPFAPFAATADPGEGEGLASCDTDLVEALEMPRPVRAALADFVAQHGVQEVSFTKRVRDRPDPEALGRRARVKGRS